MSELENLLAVQMEMVGIKDYEREYHFKLKDARNPCRFDFCWPNDDIMLVVEVEGGTWGKKSRHTTGSGFEKDCVKYNEAIIFGYSVIRVTSNQVKNGQALNWIERYLISCGERSEE